MIIKISGKQLAPENLAGIVAAWQQAGRPAWAVVHGGGIQLDAALAAFGPPQRVDGLRVTPPAAAPLVAQTLRTLGADLAASLAGFGADVIHDADGFEAVALPGLGATGAPTTYHGAPPRPGRLSLVTPVGHGPDGPLNINADDAVATLAQTWPGHDVAFISDVEGVRVNASIRSAVATQEIEGLVRSGHVHGGMVAKLRSASAIANGGAVVRIGTMECLHGTSGTVVA